MRKLAVFVAVSLVFAACSSGGDGATETPAGQAVEAISGGSGYCDQFQDLADEVDKIDYFDEDLDVQAMYSFFVDSYKQLRKSAPSELDGDYATMISGLEKYAALSDPQSTESPLTEAEDKELEAAGDRIAAHAETECGVTIDDDTDAGDQSIDVGTDKDAVAQESQGNNEATQTISLAGEAFTENLTGDLDVSCDMIGDLETGSIDIYLSGPDFESSVASDASGVKPGTYEGRIWVFANDPELDEQTWDLQEVDGDFILERAERVSDEEWLFEGSFSVAAENDPATSIEATFTCVGLVGF